jgi:hypothetical protein
VLAVAGAEVEEETAGVPLAQLRESRGVELDRRPADHSTHGA